MGIVKELFRAPVAVKLYNDYLCGLDDSFYPYDLYAKTVRSASLAKTTISDDDAREKTTVIEYDSISGMLLKDVLTEFVLFVSDKKGLDEDAFRLIGDAFGKDERIICVYADEDELNSNETIRMNPHFKPDWSPDTLLDHLYMGNVVAFRSSVLRDIKKCDNIYELCLKVCLGRKNYEICHIPDALFHSHNLKKLYASRDWQGLKKKYAYSQNEKKGQNRSVSVIIPSKDNPQTLETCLRSLIRLTRDEDYEIIIVDNGSNDENKCKIEGLLDALKQDLVDGGYVDNNVEKPLFKYVFKPQPFNFSRMCNMGAKQATGDYLLFLNDDIEIREGHWMSRMLDVAARTHTGAVGAKLLYPSSMLIQHAGISNIRLGPVHKMQFKDDRTHCYMDLNNGVHNCLAVTGACLMVAKSKFEEVGGFCEELEVAFNDVDLCFRLYENGYHNAVCNNTHLWHYESMSRGSDDSEDKLARLSSERDLLYSRHPALYAKDPYMSVHMCGDILDNNYSFIYEYDYRDVTSPENIRPFTKTVRDRWHNECLMISLEYVGCQEKFEDIGAKTSSVALISGYSYVAGSDNSCFKRSIILKGEKNSYIVDAPPVYRPDLEINLDPEEYAVMCGFSVSVDLNQLPLDTYRVAVLNESRCSRLKLYGETGKYIKVNSKEDHGLS